MFPATRLRLALWYACVTALLMLVFAGGVFVYVRFTLIDRIDDTIAHIAEVLTVPEDWNTEAIAHHFSPRIADLEADRIDLEWFSADGTLLWTTLPPAAVLPLNTQATYATVYPPSAEPLRQLTIPIQQGQELLGFIRISHPWFEVTKPIQQLFLDLTIGTLLIIGAVGVIGWWLSGIAIEPVKESYQRLKQFTADASHELRNPIAAIQTNVQVLLATADLPPELQPQLTVIERLTRRLGAVVEDLLFLARQDSPLQTYDRQPCAIAAILQEVCQEQQSLAHAKGIHLVLEPPDSSAYIQGSYSQLVRLFTNLISNAIAHTPNGGQITVRAKVSPSQVQVQIQDTGCGIAPEHLPHIFERFYRSQPQSKGSGLGLAIAKAISDNHQAQISVTSQLGQGSTFSVTFPPANP